MPVTQGYTQKIQDSIKHEVYVSKKIQDEPKNQESQADST